MEYEVLSKECDSGFMFNEVFYTIDGNVLRGYDNPEYGLQIIANRLKIGLNKL